ncbi:MAG: 2,3-bisphosphoglycerate-independent phosphoglycerate mutase, partial [Clostridia bacterium]|nr:2,3-bisphosphoglycerate-independent phosphoglycerate mutase [Clostridia bacterium]
NAEVMVDENGNAVTSHTTNPVPFWLVSEKYKNVKLNSGKLSNIAPTILKIFGIKPEDNMCDPLF